MPAATPVSGSVSRLTVSPPAEDDLSSIAAYRERALRAALDPSDPNHYLPRIPPDARRILDVGCHAGHTLEALGLTGSQAFGCDVNASALAVARRFLPQVAFDIGSAERLPYPDASFDFLYCRGVFAVVDIPRAIREFNRVLQPGGRVWIGLFRMEDCHRILRETWRKNRVRTAFMEGYMLANSGLFHCTGRMFRHPVNRSRMMSFQTEKRIRLELEKAGFCEIGFLRDRYLCVEARKAAV